MTDVIAAASADWKLGSDVMAFASVSVTAGATAPWPPPPPRPRLLALCRYDWAYICSGLDGTLERPALGVGAVPAMVGAYCDGRSPDALELLVPEHDAMLGIGDHDSQRELRDHPLQLRERARQARGAGHV